ncbi:hypothetical protein M9H77_25572 [Catharanthus roseus]|uniref:Uncharacterized protein n=1 Tax=Catharanthus roseus TaxID=4058 RepID=A0ACC0A837_CATRO|nr:hypothetical protein M9H77_25572 [Catharanthus roseus]
MDKRGFNEMISSMEEKGEEEEEEDVDFMEEDIWATDFMTEKSKRSHRSNSSEPPRRIPSSPRLISRVNSITSGVGGKCHQSSSSVIPHQSSAPVNIPADCWSKIYNNQKKPNIVKDEDNGRRNRFYFGNLEEDDEDEGHGEMIPPHEFIARRFARSPVVSYSMFEGIGRTLKGRDLSKLRNAILTKTGFLE